MLFFERVREGTSSLNGRGKLALYLTSGNGARTDLEGVLVKRKEIGNRDSLRAVGLVEEREGHIVIFVGFREVRGAGAKSRVAGFVESFLWEVMVKEEESSFHGISILFAVTSNALT